MEGWYLRIEGKEYGPYSLEQMMDYAVAGRCGPDNFVRQAASADWLEARKIPGLTEIFISTGQLNTPALNIEPPPLSAVKKPRRKSLLRRPLFWIIFILALLYLAFLLVTSFLYIIF